MNERHPGEREHGTRQKLTLALASYAVIAVLAGLTLDGKIRFAVWILMAAFAIKTWIASVSDANR
jgi:hypothetical protein